MFHLSPSARLKRGAAFLAAASLVAAPLVAAPMAFLPGTAQAVDEPVVINLLGINDFHGRIDANTTAFATTVENLRADGGEANTLFLSSGDNVGASLFASASANDNPTIDVLNALHLDASSVGNHEFDQGYDDLTGHINARADWDYLGANVYQKGTTTPAVQEFQVITVAGQRIGVIGAVTRETPSLVTPAGVATLDFGDPVTATNRVADQLTDGNDANGEADVLVATFHAGAAAPDTLEQEVAAGGEFAHIVKDLTPKVAAIYTGHTHKEYSWDAPVPGQPGKTRPIIQTGEYGNNVGQIKLSIDPATHLVTSYVGRTVDRVAAANVALPRVAAVKSIVDAAVAAANVKGKVPVASITRDITTAYATGSFLNGLWAGPDPANPKTGRDDRGSESTIGNLVADALLASLAPASAGGAEIGVTNPGGLRDELLYKGTGIDGNSDGVVTFAEANAVLPFVNNLWTTSLTGAKFKEVLEQQFQTNPDGTIPSRPFQHLGLSRNVSTTIDPSKPAGQRITSVTVDGQPLDLARNYRIGTVSFLVTGGDNYRAFKAGTDARDSGQIDRDAWITYLGTGGPKSPQFDRRQVYATGVPADIGRKQQVSIALSRLNLTSLGSPENTSVWVVMSTPYFSRTLATVPVVGGAATVTFTAPNMVPRDATFELRANPSGTVVTIPGDATPHDK